MKYHNSLIAQNPIKIHNESSSSDEHGSSSKSKLGGGHQ